MFDVAAVTEALLPAFNLTLPLPALWVTYLVALHDLCKADRLFQSKSPDLQEGANGQDRLPVARTARRTGCLVGGGRASLVVICQLKMQSTMSVGRWEQMHELQLAR